MRIRLVAGATLALIAMSMVAGCTPSAAPSAAPPSAAASQKPTTSPSPTPSTDPAAAADKAVQACTMIAEKNFVEPGVQDVLKDAAGVANDAAEADPKWDKLAQILSLLAVGYILRESNSQPFDQALPLADAQCDALGVSLVG